MPDPTLLTGRVLCTLASPFDIIWMIRDEIRVEDDERLGPIITVGLGGVQADLIGDAEILRLGRRSAMLEVRLYSDGNDVMVAHVTGTYAIPRS